MSASLPVGTILFFLVIGITVAYFALLWVRGAGPDWMWRLGRHDPVRNFFFRPDGSWRRYGKIGLFAIVALLLASGYFGL
jgi:hypothetical protein